MTDFGCQGRTRANNPCHLKYNRNHQSLYTCLSRSSSLEGILILQGYEKTKLHGGASGALRRAFRELEILDFITAARFKGELPFPVVNATRNSVICSFQQWKGNRYVPPAIHAALDWSATPLPMLEPPKPPDAWKLVDKPGKTDAVVSPAINTIRTSQKCKVMTSDFIPVTSLHSAMQDTSHTVSRSCLNWDAANWSCAYDPILTIMWNLF
ncbi:hypothetical protein BKA93DRAFT_732887, partial [Sparassis latifolia]